MTRDWRTVKLERTENSRRFKEELIRDESRLASLNITEPNENWIYLDGINVLKDDYRQIKREIIEKIIKQNPQEWEIKKICVFDGDYCSRACGVIKSEKFLYFTKILQKSMIIRVK